jgi:hypothetical protein
MVTAMEVVFARKLGLEISTKLIQPGEVSQEQHNSTVNIPIGARVFA